MDRSSGFEGGRRFGRCTLKQSSVQTVLSSGVSSNIFSLRGGAFEKKQRTAKHEDEKAPAAAANGAEGQGASAAASGAEEEGAPAAAASGADCEEVASAAAASGVAAKGVPAAAT